MLAGGGHTPVVLCCVLVYTPEPTVRRLRVPDGRRRARVAHAPKAPNDEARVFAEGGHPPRPAQHLQDNPAGRVRVATPHGLPVLVCTRVRGQLQKLAHVPAHLAVVPHDQRLHGAERGKFGCALPAARPGGRRSGPRPASPCINKITAGIAAVAVWVRRWRCAGGGDGLVQVAA